MKLTDKVDSLRERILVFGGPKSGKTKLVAELAEQFNLKYFDLENGYKTLRQLPAAWQERIELYSIPDTKIWPVAISTMLKVITGLPTSFCVEHGNTTCISCRKNGLPFESVELNKLTGEDIVVVDSATQLSLSTMSHIKRNDEELAKPEWNDYASQGFLLDKFFSQVQQAKFNICVITHEVESEMEDGRKRLVPVAGTREFSRNTAKYFDHVVYCELKNKKHTFGSATDYAISVLTGSRSGTAIEQLAKPSLLPFFRHEIPRQQGSTEAGKQMAVETIAKLTTEVGSEVVVKDPEGNTVIVAGGKLPEETMQQKLARLKAARGVK